MRVVYSEEELLSAVGTTRAEAQAAFGNPEVYLEKFLTTPRHIEVQVIGDKYGNVAVLGARDCSVQRRHQKIIEEAPPIRVNEKALQDILQRCRQACSEMGYSSVGTLEFLYQDGAFYFIEMNTRIQVEHPVTEAITGVDLIAEQIRVAAGEKLSFSEEDITIQGHAIECRINAEDPERFLPSPGQITFYHQPGGPGVRVDSHIYTGYTIPPYYDSLAGKIITYGKDRHQALARMKQALEEAVVEGIETNIPLLQQVIEHHEFEKGGVSIHFLAEMMHKK